VRLVATNPTRRFDGEEIAELVSLGAYAEFTFLSHLSSGNAEEKIIADVEAVGADHCIVSTDGGNWVYPPPAECMRMAIAAMLSGGLGAEAVKKVVKDNPLDLIGLGPGTIAP
jgi:predicted TIM-barrel fold metal-dependent hydrolase